MFAGQQTLFSHGVMQFDRRGDDDRVEADAVQDVVVMRGAFNFGIERVEVSEALLADVAHRFQFATRNASEIANEIGSPVPATHHSNFYWLNHFVVPCEIGQSSAFAGGTYFSPAFSCCYSSGY